MMLAKFLVCLSVVLMMTGCSPASPSPNDLWLQGLQLEIDGTKYTEAAKAYREAADRGHAGAMTCLGRLYEDGRGVPQDYGEAINWYRKAVLADKSQSQAMAYLGNLYEKGHGVPQDYTRAAEWYRLAAGDYNGVRAFPPAQTDLGRLLEEGKGGALDKAEAASWYGRAANSGYAPAAANLARMYEMGEGVPQDYSQAYKWAEVTIQRSEGEPQRKQSAEEKRNALAKKMSPIQIMEAQRQAGQLIKSLSGNTAQ